jgi:imidazolonepropionase-like amidohydrolase/Tol biopolymer transport system component
MNDFRTLLTGTLLALAAGSGGLQAGEEATGEDAWDVDAPPGEARQVHIDVQTGTWMSLDVSPDGQTIAFDLLGDIYLLPFEGGEARAVHSGLNWSMQPRFSPDGAEIAFISDAGGGDNVWLMNADGSAPRQITEEDFRLLNNPYWAPGGDYIAARKHFTTTRSLGTGEIWLYHRGGGEGVAVVERPDPKHQKELGEPAFSPDGRYLYFSVDSTPGGVFQYAQDSNAQIYEIRRHDLETDKTEPFVTGPGGAVRPTPSPDGRHLAFVRRIRADSALFLKDLENGREWPIYTELDQDLQEVWGVQGLYPNLDWTPDSKQVVFWAGGGIKRIDIASGEVADIPFHVQDTRTVYAPPRPAVAVAPAEFDTHMARNAEVSPHGSAIVWESAGKLYVRELPDGEPHRLTRDESDAFEYDPAWTPDGKRIAFVAWDDRALGQIRSARATGGYSRQLTRRPGHYHAPRYSPNGETIVFEISEGGALTAPEWAIETGVFAIPAGGGPARQVTDNGANPHFGGRSDRLYVTRPREEGDGIALVSIDLKGDKPVVHATAEFARRFEVAPDDRHLAFGENYHVYVLPLPPGGKPLELGTTVKSLPMVRASGDGGNFPSWSNRGQVLNWTLGATAYSASLEALFARKSDAPDESEEIEETGQVIDENAQIVDENGAGGDDEENVDNDELVSAYDPPDTGHSLSLRLEADVPAGAVALTGATLVTMSGPDGGVIEDGVIVIEGNRIAAVGGPDTVVPDGAQRVDVAGKTIIPGLIDAHAHGSQGVGLIPQQNWMAYATLALGVTTVHDPSNDAAEVFAAAELQRTGQILAPRIFSTGDIVYGARSTDFAEIDSLDDARHHVRRLKAQGAMSVKNYNQPRREQRQQVTTAAREENLLVVSEGASLYHMDLSMVADGNSTIEHNLPQSMLYDDVLQFWSQTDVAYTPTLVVTYGGLTAEQYWYQETEVWKHPILSRFVPPDVLNPRAVRRIKAPDADYHHVVSANTARLLSEEGVLVSIGAHGQREGLASHWEIWSFVQGGMSPVEALAAATITPARALGYAADLGSLEPGKLADLVVIDADVLQNIYLTDRVTHVMLNGRLYEAATLNETVTGDRKTEPFFWQGRR